MAGMMQPNGAHHALLNDLSGLLESRYGSMPAVERTAIVAQMLGRQLAAVPDHYSRDHVMNAIMANVVEGNRSAMTEASAFPLIVAD